jgi:glycine/D-amino acid oxidase-like deaminating enzyme
MSRRAFVGALAGTPAALRSLTLQSGDRQPRGGGPAPHVCVVGAGAFGGWAALHLLREGARVDLFDAWGPGNARSSSGDESRVIRAVYGPDRVYVRMVRRSFELWEELQRASGATVYRETGALWMVTGDDRYVRSALPILEEEGFPVETLAIEEARRRWPQIEFAGVDAAWLERRAGLLYARDACAVVRQRFVEEGGRYHQAGARPQAPEDGRMQAIVLDDGSRFTADAYLFACGPWLAGLFPEALGEMIRPSRQEVYYFGTPAGDRSFGPDRLPVWVDLGPRIVYGLPDAQGRGVKIADDTRGGSIDPTTDERLPSRDGIERARRFLAGRFPALRDAPLVEARVCQYENSPDGHLILDRHPEAGNVWFAGGGSGHGFKLSPAFGEMAARCLLGRGEPEPAFRLGRAGDRGRPSTQFDRR